MKDWLIEFGLKLPDLAAGFCGGLVKALVFHQGNPGATLVSTIVGALTANYLSEAAAAYLGMGRGAAGFITGLVAMAVCQGIMDAASKWKPQILRGGGNGPT